MKNNIYKKTSRLAKLIIYMLNLVFGLGRIRTYLLNLLDTIGEINATLLNLSILTEIVSCQCYTDSKYKNELTKMHNEISAQMAYNKEVELKIKTCVSSNKYESILYFYFITLKSSNIRRITSLSPIIISFYNSIQKIMTLIYDTNVEYYKNINQGTLKSCNLQIAKTFQISQIPALNNSHGHSNSK